eukprot:88988-Chlamydomonas_euryale.AAC.2
MASQRLWAAMQVPPRIRGLQTHAAASPAPPLSPRAASPATIPAPSAHSRRRVSAGSVQPTQGQHAVWEKVPAVVAVVAFKTVLQSQLVVRVGPEKGMATPSPLPSLGVNRGQASAGTGQRRDGSNKGRVKQGTGQRRDGSNKGRVKQGTGQTRDGSKKDAAGQTRHVRWF